MSVNLYKEAKNRTQKELEKKVLNDPTFHFDNVHPYYGHHFGEKMLRLLERGDFRVGSGKIPGDVGEHRARERSAKPMLGETHEFKTKVIRARGAKERRLAGDDAQNKVKEGITSKLLETRENTLNQKNNDGQSAANRNHNDSEASHASKPKFLSTRKGKAIAAGGALATVGALGSAYAYKKHLDKKREEANER